MPTDDPSPSSDTPIPVPEVVEAVSQPLSNAPAERWTEPLMRDGFIPIARLFLRNYGKLRPHPLTTGEAIFVIHLMDFKRDKNPPYPSYKRLAEYMGVSDKMVRLHAKRLQEKGYLRRVVRIAKPNQFDLTPLFQALERHTANNKSQPTRNISQA